jgi:hypothetical protein
MVQFWPRLWNIPVCFLLLARTENIEKTKEVWWIHRMKPPSLVLSKDAARVTATSLISGEIDGSEGWLFVRLFGISLSDSSAHSPELIACVNRLMFDEREFVAAGALQVMTKWLLVCDIQFAKERIYQAAAQVYEEKRGQSLRYLYTAFLAGVASHSQPVASIIASDLDVQYCPDFSIAIAQENWCFPGFLNTLERLSTINLSPYEDSMTVLGYIVDQLGLNTNCMSCDGSRSENETELTFSEMRRLLPVDANGRIVDNQ